MSALDRTVDENFVDKLYDKMTHVDGWMSQGNCVGSRINMFKQPNRFAKLCEHCPVKKQCGELGDRLDVKHGVFGGKVIRPAKGKKKK